MLPELLAQIPDGEPVVSVSADGAYDTRGCLDAIAQGGAQALIPPRKTLSQPKRGDARLQTLWAAPVESLERLPPAQFGGNQNALLQAPG